MRRMWVDIAVLVAVVGAGVAIYWNSNAVESALNDLLTGPYKFPPQAEPYKSLVSAAALAHGVPVALMGAEITKESDWQPDAYNPRSGASGIAQFEPLTAADLGVKPMDPTSAIPGMARYLAQLHAILSAKGYPQWSYTLAAYDWGIDNVLDALAAGRSPATWPPETRDYVSVITSDSGVDTATGILFA